MAKIDIKCDECGHEARVPEAFRGKKVRCLRCRAKLRVPGDPGGPPSGPVVTLDDSGAGTSRSQSRASRETKPPQNRSGDKQPPRGVVTPGAGGVSSKVRREVQQAIREILGDYEHAIEDSPRGFVVDLRGVAFGLARTLVEDLIASPGVRDAKLAGGTGECRITITLEGAVYDPDDSFADDDDETEIFRRPTASDVRSPLDASAADEASNRRTRATKDPEREPRPTRSKAPDDGRPSRPTREDARSTGAAASGGGGDIEKLLEEGKDLIAQGDVQAAIDVFEKAVRVDKTNATAVSALGQAYMRAGDWERARRAFKHLTSIRPDDADSHIFHAAAAMDCERLDDARDALSLAVKLQPDNARAYKYAAKLYERTGDTDRAKKFRAKYEQLKGR